VVLVTHETQTAEFANRIITIRDGLVESDKKIVAHSLRGKLK
jgi:ABC-type lipoprotein export system ATPase subunit